MKMQISKKINFQKTLSVTEIQRREFLLNYAKELEIPRKDLIAICSGEERRKNLISFCRRSEAIV